MEPQQTLLSIPPTEFKRMLSWQLSSASSVPSKKKKKKKKVKPKDTSPPPSSDDSECSDDISLSDDPLDCDEEGYEFTYMVVNSDGEEEIYYSAQESPIQSDDDEGDFPLKLKGVESCSPIAGRKKAKSKKQKKKVRYLARMAEVEFFRPLCQLMEDNMSVEVGEIGVASRTQVPCLVELCLRVMRKDDNKSPDDLPYLIRSLLDSDRSNHSIVATHVRWLERNLAAPFDITTRKHHDDPKSMWGRPFVLQYMWEVSSRIPQSDAGLHVPLPLVTRSWEGIEMRENKRKCMTGPFLHFVNFLFPMFSSRGQSAVQSSEVMTPAQLAAIHHVNNFVQSRYKSLCSEVLAGLLLLWPGYVYWARGHVKLAAVAFKIATEKLEFANDKAAVLNEIGRMFSLFGEKEVACRFFRESSSIVETEKQLENTKSKFPADAEMIQPSALALEAAVYDCGLLTPSMARNSARLWKSVLRMMDNLSQPKSSFWALHLAACEAKMLVHSGTITGNDPSHPLASGSPSLSPAVQNQRYLEECRELLTTLSSKQAILHYHLSMVHAMLGHPVTSKNSWREFMEMFMYGLNHLEWPTWLTESNSKFHMFNTPTPAQWYPWQPLIDMMLSDSLKHAPVLKLLWRTRLLHPHYPYYYSTDTSSMLADHCSQSINIRLTQDGYITADCHMDLPPMRAVLMDPYTGDLCFPRNISKDHFYQRPFALCLDTPVMNFRSKDHFFMPWPARVFESDSCVIELTTGSTQKGSFDNYPNDRSSNYSTLLHFYGSDGSHKKLDLRKRIRKELAQTIRDRLRNTEFEDKLERLDKFFESGDYLGISYILWHDLNKPKHQKKQKKTHPIFVLHLVSVVAYGKATLLLAFSLQTGTNDNNINVLVFVNCSDIDTFSWPVIYCVGDPPNETFQLITPSPSSADCLAYRNNHFKHCKYAIAVCSTKHLKTRNCYPLSYMMFDENGTTVTRSESLGDRTRLRTDKVNRPHFSVGRRLFGWRVDESNGLRSIVYSCDTYLADELTSQPIHSATISTFLAVPGLLFIHTFRGLALLHPRTLTPVDVDGLSSSEAAVAMSDTSDETVSYHFKVGDALFNVLKVWNDDGCLEDSRAVEDQSSDSLSPGEIESEKGQQTTEAESIEQEVSESSEECSELVVSRLNGCDCNFGSCYVAFAVDNRLVVLDVKTEGETVKCLIDVKLPGRPTELHPMGASGYMVSVTNFHDHFREEVYWLTVTGRLRGVLPCLGVGPRSFASVTLPGRDGVEGVRCEGGLFVYFSDGQGGVACVRLSE